MEEGGEEEGVERGWRSRGLRRGWRRMGMRGIRMEEGGGKESEKQEKWTE